jgi:uncharacterized protein YjbI with pentapeptide repeats
MRGLVQSLIKTIKSLGTLSYVGWALLFLSIFLLVLLAIAENSEIQVLTIDLSTNLVAEIMGIALTVLVIDRLSRNRTSRESQDQLKSQLIRDMGGPLNQNTIKAARDMSHYGWLHDGSLNNCDLSESNLEQAPLIGARLVGVNLSQANLRGANLRGANLSSANLINADLTGANLEKAILKDAELECAVVKDADLSCANLQSAYLFEADLENARLRGADLRGADLKYANLKQTKEWDDLEDPYDAYNFHPNVLDHELAQAYSLQGAIMLNGSTYDGRYNLAGDFIYAVEDGFPIPRDFDGPHPYLVNGLADFYQISVEEYTKGQKWADENLPLEWEPDPMCQEEISRDLLGRPQDDDIPF